MPSTQFIEKNSIFIVVVRLSRIEYEKKSSIFFLFSYRNPRLDTNKSFDSTRHFGCVFFLLHELNVKVFYISVHIIRRHIHTAQHNTQPIHRLICSRKSYDGVVAILHSGHIL